MLRSSCSLRRAGRAAPGVRGGRIARSTLRPSPCRPACIRDGLSCRSRHAPEPYPALQPCLLPALLGMCGLKSRTVTPDGHALLSNRALRAVVESTVMQNEHAMTVVRHDARLSLLSSQPTPIIGGKGETDRRLHRACWCDVLSDSNVT